MHSRNFRNEIFCKRIIKNPWKVYICFLVFKPNLKKCQKPLLDCQIYSKLFFFSGRSPDHFWPLNSKRFFKFFQKLKLVACTIYFIMSSWETSLEQWHLGWLPWTSRLLDSQQSQTRSMSRKIDVRDNHHPNYFAILVPEMGLLLRICNRT